MLFKKALPEEPSSKRSVASCLLQSHASPHQTARSHRGGLRQFGLPCGRTTQATTDGTWYLDSQRKLGLRSDRCGGKEAAGLRNVMRKAQEAKNGGKGNGSATGRLDLPTLGLALDLRHMRIPEAFFQRMSSRMQAAFEAMKALEGGAIANPDEKRMVGHYWLRNPSIAPTPSIRQGIETTIRKVKEFAARVHSGQLKGQGGRFENFLLIGIGGSVLGPQFVAHALGNPQLNLIRPFFLDNTDPDGMQRVMAALDGGLGKTLTIVTSKSGGTVETSNGMKEVKNAYERAGLCFEKHAVAITQESSQLDKLASESAWLQRFPIWEWVGGRTSELSAVGLLPAALQGFSVDELLAGARASDVATRSDIVTCNPSGLLALAWYFAGNGNGTKNMVVAPYKDRLELLGRYLQQLIMESLGKELDLQGKVVNQGICVFGNKGTSDQHSYFQQVRDGIDNCFLTIIEVRRQMKGAPVLVHHMTTSGDYLHAFCEGTIQAITTRGRGVIKLTIDEVSPFSVGMLIALFERAVGIYASLVNINAYHQPGVEAGKRAANQVIELQDKVRGFLEQNRGKAFSPSEIHIQLGNEADVKSVAGICQTWAANAWTGIQELPCKHPLGEKRFRLF